MAAGDVDVKTTTMRCLNSNMFDGVDDYVEIPHSASQLGASLANGFTMSAWICPKSLGEGSTGRILDKSTSSTAAAGFLFSINNTTNVNSLRFRMNNGTIGLSSANSVVYGTWQHVLVTVSSGQLANFYVNGVLSGTANQDLVQTISIITTTNPLRIGNRAYDTGSTFDGAIRHVKMWKRVLTAAEIAADYAGTPATSGLIHWFKLGGDYTDYGSVGVTATNSGSVQRIVEDLAKTAIKTQRTTAGASGKYMIFSGRAGQLGSVAITE
jgi:hypothetical protein